MKVYDVVSANSPEELAIKVNAKVEEGYAPFGSISISTVVEKYNTVTSVYVQAVALVPEEECQCCNCKDKEVEQETDKTLLVEPANATKSVKKPTTKKKK